MLARDLALVHEDTGEMSRQKYKDENCIYYFPKSLFYPLMLITYGMQRMVPKMSSSMKPVNVLWHGKGALKLQMELRLLIGCPKNREKPNSKDL